MDRRLAQEEQAKSIFQQAQQAAQPARQQLKQNRELLPAAVKANDTARIPRLSLGEDTLRGPPRTGNLRASHWRCQARWSRIRSRKWIMASRWPVPDVAGPLQDGNPAYCLACTADVGAV